MQINKTLYLMRFADDKLEKEFYKFYKENRHKIEIYMAEVTEEEETLLKDNPHMTTASLFVERDKNYNKK